MCSMTSSGVPRVAVAMCTYNGAAYLQAQLNSLLVQTVPLDEIVIGDDGSSDATLSLLNDFAEHAVARGIHVDIVRRPRNLGYVLNFADVLQRCTAEIVFLCDQDDVWCPDRVETYLAKFDSDSSLLLLHSDARLVDGAGEPLGAGLFGMLQVHPAELELERSGLVLDAILMRNFVTGATCALRRSLLANGLPIGSKWSHDEWLAVVASLEGGLDVLPQATIDYRQHGGNQIGASRRSIRDRLRNLALLDERQRTCTERRLRALLALLSERGVQVAPARLNGLSALTWRMAWSRLQLYRRPDVEWTWIAHDAPRLLARLANACLAGGGWRAAAAACGGAWAGLRGRPLR